METIIDTYAPEFGYELILIVPLVYKHHLNGDRTTVITTRGMRCFYYFLPEDCVIEKYTKRTEKTNNVYEIYMPQILKMKSFQTTNHILKIKS